MIMSLFMAWSLNKIIDNNCNQNQAQRLIQTINKTTCTDLTVSHTMQ